MKEQKYGKERFTECVLALGLTNLLTKYESELMDEYMEDEAFCNAAERAKGVVSPYVQRKVEELTPILYPLFKEKMQEIPEVLYEENGCIADICHNELLERQGVCIYSENEFAVLTNFDLVEDTELWMLEDGDFIAVMLVILEKENLHVEYRTIKSILSIDGSLSVDSDSLLDRFDSIEETGSI